MLEPKSSGRITYAEFLAFTADKDERYEFVDGRAVAMGIPTDEHQRLVKILNRKLDDHFGAGPCEALPSVALWTIERERAPDILVRCRNAANEREARVTIEIMSSHRGDDLGDKVTEYQSVQSIQNYVVIDSTRHWIRCYTRNSEGLFVAAKDYIGGLLLIDSITYTLDIDGLYREAGL
jgi:Uma2 family endonuclease